MASGSATEEAAGASAKAAPEIVLANKDARKMRFMVIPCPNLYALLLAGLRTEENGIFDSVF
ncbi:hypothetical protein GCM10008941_02400 [Rhizomicrobium palustre]